MGAPVPVALRGLRCGGCDTELIDGGDGPQELTCGDCQESICTECAAVYLADADCTGDPPTYQDCSKVQCRNCVVAEVAPAMLVVLDAAPDPTAYADDAYGQRMFKRDSLAWFTGARALAIAKANRRAR